MKVIKNINNNVSLCLDSQNREVIAFGRGIGFTKPPCDIPLEKINRTFYDINDSYISVIEQIDEDILNLAKDIIDYANRTLENQIGMNAILTLADHIQFTIQRFENNIDVQLPLFYEMKRLYPAEMAIGEFAVRLINKRMEVKLPKEESVNIAMHLVNYRKQIKNASRGSQKTVIEKCSDIIEETMNIEVNKDGFNYSRFVTHLYYLIDRMNTHEGIHSDNKKMYEILKEEYPKAYECVLKMEKVFQKDFRDEEKMYLILHVNRLCGREGCNH